MKQNVITPQWMMLNMAIDEQVEQLNLLIFNDQGQSIPCRVLDNGARAHIGSAYYTGEPPLAQPSTIDLYLPDLAMLVNTLHKGESFNVSSSFNASCFPRHSSANDLYPTPVELVRKFLSTTGVVQFSFEL
ncbi:hypothetical protein FRX31_026342 [Thalictrum thalictroides]|uniref:Uncharacterized protein n=1 Tax=Thalictrum thalictroides TaxID=46969 RepID=A0A7J6VIE6_THATH|nr:hypothetical protein FRX31_026342 [Thalictrum thalictroides]